MTSRTWDEHFTTVLTGRLFEDSLVELIKIRFIGVTFAPLKSVEYLLPVFFLPCFGRHIGLSGREES